MNTETASVELQFDSTPKDWDYKEQYGRTWSKVYTCDKPGYENVRIVVGADEYPINPRKNHQCFTQIMGKGRGYEQMEDGPLPARSADWWWFVCNNRRFLKEWQESLENPEALDKLFTRLNSWIGSEPGGDELVEILTEVESLAEFDLPLAPEDADEDAYIRQEQIEAVTKWIVELNPLDLVMDYMSSQDADYLFIGSIKSIAQRVGCEATEEAASKILTSEMEEFRHYIDGEVYYWSVQEQVLWESAKGETAYEWETVESCSGYYGDMKYVLSEAVSTANAIAKSLVK